MDNLLAIILLQTQVEFVLHLQLPTLHSISFSRWVRKFHFQILALPCFVLCPTGYSGKRDNRIVLQILHGAKIKNEGKMLIFLLRAFSLYLFWSGPLSVELLYRTDLLPHLSWRRPRPISHNHWEAVQTCSQDLKCFAAWLDLWAGKVQYFQCWFFLWHVEWPGRAKEREQEVVFLHLLCIFESPLSLLFAGSKGIK